MSIEDYLKKYPRELINSLGNDYDVNVANKFGLHRDTIKRLRLRLDIDGYLSRRVPRLFECSICGKKVKRYPLRVEQFKHIFCSKVCEAKWLSRESEDIICEVCGRKKNIPKSQFDRDVDHHFCSYKCRGIWYRRENNPRWKGGYYRKEIVDSNWYIVRNQVLERDNHICRVCGIKSNKPLHIHHIIPFRISKSNDISNLITLCSNCHQGIVEPNWQYYANEWYPYKNEF